MGKRQDWISNSILRAIYHDVRTEGRALLRRVLALFAVFRVKLARFEPVIFRKLRADIWKLNEDDYRESFNKERSQGGLNPVGDLGYSGSTFFVTWNSKYLIKSLPRRFEYKFFEDDLIRPYYDHMQAHSNSLLVRITDFLTSSTPSLGNLIGVTPSRHVVMENILYGKESSDKKEEWETYDLKPTSYFFPERDIAGGSLASEATKSRLADEFPDKIRITRKQYEDLEGTLKEDTELLKQANAVDYSLMLVRYPASSRVDYLGGVSNEWRTGAESFDHKWKYRAVLLDFFWAKHTANAQTMDTLIQTYNVVGQHGPMSITTTAEEYRDRFLTMVKDIVEVRDEE